MPGHRLDTVLGCREMQVARGKRPNCGPRLQPGDDEAYGGSLGQSVASKPLPVLLVCVYDTFPFHRKAGVLCSGLSPQPRGGFACWE